MIKISREKLEIILKKHIKWLHREKGGERADLSSADLRSADLSSANLSSADLSSANLSSADLRSADLSYANLSSANLSSANLSSANLSSANLSYANLSYANLSKRVVVINGICKWSLRYNEYTDKKLRIGCEARTITEWNKFFKSTKTIETPRNTAEFKRIKLAFETIKTLIKLWGMK